MLTLALMASVIVAGARTPFGKFGGAFKDVPAKSLGPCLRTGAAALCGGGGQGDALIVRRPR
jgi:acetyl-CoA C-acetyltransferase